MSFKLDTLTRNTQIAVVNTRLNFDGTQPSATFEIMNAIGTVLWSVNLNATNPFGTPSGGRMILNGIPLQAAVTYTGIASRYRFQNRELVRTTIILGDVGSVRDDGTGDVNLSSLYIYAGDFIRVSFAYYTGGNA